MNTQHMSMLPTYVSTRAPAQALGWLFLFTAAVSWLAVGYDFAEIRLTSAVFAGTPVEPAERLAHGATGRFVSSFQIFCFAMTGLAFLPWLYRVRVNVRAMGMRRMRYRREWTVLGFLIPVANLLVPHQVVSEVWRASDPRSLEPMGWRALPAPTLVTGWWLAFVAYVGFEILASSMLGASPGVRRIRFAYSLEFFGDVCAAISASLAYFVVTGIAEAQDAKRSLLVRGVHLPTEAGVTLEAYDAFV